MPLTYDYSGYPSRDRLDLANIPKECITVSVSIADEKLKEAVVKRIRLLKGSLDNAKQTEQWGVAHRVSCKLKVLEDVLKEAAL
ncbi:hypothetical protein [Streptomyces sp. DG1A-41]|uniref:hypothetical protein n=1 Tax=Streptomyces sp. DG1A-41 TaxID=3125779 RepID=UPI0030CCE8EF